MDAFDGFFRDKTVLVTGHTGFKGSWLCTWLTQLGARVIGYALEAPTEPNNFSASRLDQRITHLIGDVRDESSLQTVFTAHQPQIVFHLAAQSLVRLSFAEPLRTYGVNVMGTANVLDCALRTDSVRAVVSITSDKCYRNVGWDWGYRETDILGGHDPYSASKAAAEMAIGSYQDPRFQRAAVPGRELPIASARAGNVTGGGDWAPDRVIPDVVRAIVSRKDIVLRSPEATRPWQHVLEPISGYLWLGCRLAKDPRGLCASWNFGPQDGETLTVQEVASRIIEKWEPPATSIVIRRDDSGAESKLLRLDSSKARQQLGWHVTWPLDKALTAIVDWYKSFYSRPQADMFDVSLSQIDEYTRCARGQSLAWTRTGG